MITRYNIQYLAINLLRNLQTYFYSYYNQLLPYYYNLFIYTNAIFLLFSTVFLKLIFIFKQLSLSLILQRFY